MSDHSPGPTLRVLVVDDRRDAVLLLKTLLSHAGHQVETAADGASGLETIRQFLPHVVISDIGLGGSIDGYALARAIRSDPAIAASELIAVTGHDDEEHRRMARDAGFDHYLVKPAPMGQLLELLATIAGGNGSGA